MKSFGKCLCVLMLILVPACGLLVEEGREVIAEVGEKPIRLNDLLRRIRGLPFERRAETNDPDESARLEARRSILTALVNEALLATEAEARRITVSDAEVEAALEQEESRGHAMEGLIPDEFKGAAGGHDHGHGGEGHSRSELKEMRQKLVIEKMLATQLSETAARTYYDENVDAFLLPSPLLNCELIVVGAQDKAFIDTIHQRALQERMPLGVILASLTDAPPVVFAGTTPLATLNDLVPAMRVKVKDLKAGDVSEPFRLYSGEEEQYAVARVINYVDKQPFEAVKEPIRRKLFGDFIEELKQKYGVVYYEEKLNYRVDR